MIKWQVLALNSLPGTPSTQASFIRKYFTYLLQAAPQSKLRTNFWALLRMTMKNRTTFGSASQQCSAARQDFPSWKLTHSRGRTARQHKSTSRAASYQQHRYKSNAKAAGCSQLCPSPAPRTTRAFPALNSQLDPFSAGTSGASGWPGKAPQAPHPATSPECFQEHAPTVSSRRRNPHLVRLTACPEAGQQHRPASHEFGQTKRIH